MDLPIIAGVAFREVSGLPGYAVGDDGSVWSKKRQGKAPDGEWKMMKFNANRKGYLGLTLSDNGRGRMFAVHVLVLSSFCGARPRGMEAAHNNGVPSDNRLCNLRWATPQENAADKTRHGTAIQGDKSHMSKLTSNSVKEIAHRYANGETLSRLASSYGVTTEAIHFIVSGKNWKAVTGGKVVRRIAPVVDRKGESNPQAKLTEGDVKEMRALRAAGVDTRTLISRFGVCKATVVGVLNGSKWSHV